MHWISYTINTWHIITEKLSLSYCIKQVSGARSKGLKYECKFTIMSNFLKNFSKKGGQNCKFVL